VAGGLFAFALLGRIPPLTLANTHTLAAVDAMAVGLACADRGLAPQIVAVPRLLEEVL